MTEYEKLKAAGFLDDEILAEAGFSPDEAAPPQLGQGKAEFIQKPADPLPWEDNQPSYPGKPIVTTATRVVKRFIPDAYEGVIDAAKSLPGLLGLTPEGRKGWRTAHDVAMGAVSSALSDEDKQTQSADEARQRAIWGNVKTSVGNKLTETTDKLIADPWGVTKDAARGTFNAITNHPADAYFLARGGLNLAEKAGVQGAGAVEKALAKADPISGTLGALKQVPTIPERLKTARAVTGGFTESPLGTLDALMSGAGYNPSRITDADLGRFLGMSKINRSKGHMDTPMDEARMKQLALRMYQENIPNSMKGQEMADIAAAELHAGAENFLTGRAAAGDVLGVNKDIVGSTKGLLTSPPDMAHLKPRFRNYAELANEAITDPNRPAFNKGLHNRVEAAKRTMQEQDLLDPKAIPVDLAWNEKQALYRKARSAGAYGANMDAALAKEVEFNKTLAESILDATVKKYPELAEAGIKEGDLIDLARIIRDSMYKHGKTDLITLKDSVLAAEALGAPTPLNPAGMAAALRKLITMPEVKGWIARQLYRSRNPDIATPRLENFLNMTGKYRLDLAAPGQEKKKEGVQ